MSEIIVSTHIPPKQTHPNFFLYKTHQELLGLKMTRVDGQNLIDIIGINPETHEEIYLTDDFYLEIKVLLDDYFEIIRQKPRRGMLTLNDDGGILFYGKHKLMSFVTTKRVNVKFNKSNPFFSVIYTKDFTEGLNNIQKVTTTLVDEEEEEPSDSIAMSD